MKSPIQSFCAERIQKLSPEENKSRNVYSGMTIISRYLNRNRHKTRISGIEVTQEHTIPLAHAPGSVNQSLREDSGLSLPDVNSDDTRIKPLKPDGEAEATSKNIENLSTTWVIMRDEVTA